MEKSDLKRAGLTSPVAANTARPAAAGLPPQTGSSSRPADATAGSSPHSGPGRALSSGAPKAPPGAGAWLLRKRGSSDVLRCPDLATLRTWMLERRVSRDDEISRGGKVYRRLGSIVEFESLFHSVDVERVEKRSFLTKQATAQPVSALSGPTSSPTRSGTPRAVPVLSASASPSSDSPALEKVQISPPGLTSTSSQMSPLRLTPSGQAPRPRPPQVAPSISSVPPPPVPPPILPPVNRTGEPAKPAVPPPPPISPPVNRTSEPAKPAVPPPPPISVPLPAPPAATPAPVAKAPPPAPVPELPTPSAAAVPVVIENDDLGAQPTTRFTRLEPAKPAAAQPSISAPIESQTVPFERPAIQNLHEVPSGSQRTEPLPTKLIDPIEEAFKKSDPVPRHLKEAADPDRTARYSTNTDHTERFEKNEGRRGLLLFAASLGITGILVLALQQAGKNDPSFSIEERPTTTAGTKEPSGSQASAPATHLDKPGLTNRVQATPLPPADNGGPKPSRGQETPRNSGAGTTVGTGTPATSPPIAKPSQPANAVLGTTGATATPQKPPAPTPATGTQPKPPTLTPVAATLQKPPAPTPVAATPQKPPAPTPVAATPQKPPAPTPAVAAPQKPAPMGKKLVITEIPKTFDEQMELAQRLVEHEQFDEAQRLFETILGSAAHVPAVHVGLGKCALEQGRTAEAIQHYQNALSRLATYGPALFGLAKAYRQRGDKEQAISWYKKYLDQNPTGSAATAAREAIAKLGEKPPPQPHAPSELIKPPAPTQNASELVKPQ